MAVLLSLLSADEAKELASQMRIIRDYANYVGDNARYPYCFPILDMAGEFGDLYFEALDQYYRSVITEHDEFMREAKKWHAE